MNYRIASNLLILFCLLIYALPAWSTDRKHDLIEQLVSNPDILTDQQSNRKVLIDSTARRLFFGLRTGADWSAGHPLWRQHYPEFLREYRQLVDSHLGDVAAMQRERLMATMSEDALAQVVALRTAPDLVALFSRLRSAGVSAATALWIPDVVGNPRYYTQAEQDEASRLQQKILSPDAGLTQLMLEVEAKMERFRTPAFAAYTRTVRDVLFSPVESFPNAAEPKPELVAFLRRWHSRLNPGE